MAVWNIMEGDCRLLLAEMKKRGVMFDSAVTDPPYHLTIAKRFAKTSVDDNNSTGKSARNRSTPYSRLSRGFMGMEWDGGNVAFLPETWKAVYDVLKPGAYLVAFGGTRTSHRVACAIEDAGFEIRDTVYWMYGQGFAKSEDVGQQMKKAKLAEAEQWEGWETSLKPAIEPAVLARKPLIGTVVQNVLKYGTGAMNVKECAIAGTVSTNPAYRNTPAYRSNTLIQGATHQSPVSFGRHPANLVHDGSEEVLKSFAKYGDRTSTGTIGSAAGRKTYNGGWAQGPLGAPTGYGDTGSIDRYYYTAKADSTDRAWSNHPTVKPLDLIHWLIKLVTPPGGTVLDPFAGSGTTLQAAVEHGFNAVGCELMAQYVKDIERRMTTFCGWFDRRDPFIPQRRQMRG